MQVKKQQSEPDMEKRTGQNWERSTFKAVHCHPAYLTYMQSVCMCVCVCVAQLCPTLCDPMDCSPSGSSVHRILQARILEWVAISFSNMQSSSCEMPSWMNLKLVSRLLGEISINSDM